MYTNYKEVNSPTREYIAIRAVLSVLAPDKRDTNTSTVVPPAPPKRLAHKRNTEWSMDDDSESQNEPNDLRDSGISTASLLDFQSHLSNLNNLGYEDFEPRTRCNDIMNISPPSVISALNVSTGSFSSGTFQGSHSLPGQEVNNQDEYGVR